MGRPLGSKNSKPATGGAVMNPPAVEPVRQQIKEMNGFINRDELKNALPDSTAGGATTVDATEKKTRKSKVTAPSSDFEVLMQTDARFKAIVGGMTSFGGSRAIKTLFKSTAVVTKKKNIELSTEEAQTWDDYFYVVGKVSNFDPTRPWYLAIYSLILLSEQIFTRLWELNKNSFANQIGKLFGFADDEKLELPTTEDETEGVGAD